MQGSCTSNRENDVLTQTLGNKEHPGCTRGVGNVLWKLAFEEDAATYRSRLRGKETIEAEYTRVMKEMEANFEKQLDVRVEQRVSEITASRRLAQQPVLTSSSP
jgi:hypothetical protein